MQKGRRRRRRRFFCLDRQSPKLPADRRVGGRLRIAGRPSRCSSRVQSSGDGAFLAAADSGTARGHGGRVREAARRLPDSPDSRLGERAPCGYELRPAGRLVKTLDGELVEIGAGELADVQEQAVFFAELRGYSAASRPTRRGFLVGSLTGSGPSAGRVSSASRTAKVRLPDWWGWRPYPSACRTGYPSAIPVPAGSSSPPGGSPVWHPRAVAEVVLDLGADVEDGLDREEIDRRRARYGANVIAEGRRRGPLPPFVDQFGDFMVLILSSLSCCRMPRSTLRRCTPSSRRSRSRRAADGEAGRPFQGWGWGLSPASRS